MGMNEWMKGQPLWLIDVMNAASKWSGISWSKASGDPRPPEDGRRPYPALRGAEAIGSCYDPGRPAEDDGLGTVVRGYERQHIVMLDIDHEAALIPSSTPGHHHLIVNLQLGHSDYMDLLSTMAEVGLIQPGFFDASRDRGETFLRLPWVQKGTEADDAAAAIEEWLDADERPEEFQDPEALEAWLTTG